MITSDKHAENLVNKRSEEISENVSPSLPLSVLIDINSLNSSNAIKSFLQPAPNKSTIHKQQIGLTDDGFIVRNKPHTINAPIFNFIIHNSKANHIPRELLNDYVGSFNLSNQTPLMLSAALSNLNFVLQLLPVDVGILDTFGKSALDYAKQFNASNEVIQILSEYETY